MNRRIIQIIFLSILLSAMACNHAPSDSSDKNEGVSLDFSGPLSHAVLDAYLAKAITMSDLLRPDSFFFEYGFEKSFDRQLDFIASVRPLFLGRAMLVWAMESMFMQHMEGIEDRVARIHQIDDRIIVQGAIFEAVSLEVENIAIFDYVFEAFGLEVEERNFSYEEMLFEDQRDQFGDGISVPDMTRQETRLWFYFVATLYIDAGFEAIHLGQIDWIAEKDTDLSETAELIEAIRKYAADNARRKWVLLDGHTHGLVRGDDLLLDFHSFPLRLYRDPASPVGADISPDWPKDGVEGTSIYGRSRGGKNPSGWKTDANLYLVEFDHGYSKGSMEANTGQAFIEGLDEITWFAEQDSSLQGDLLEYLFGAVKILDEAGHLQPAGIRQIWVNHIEKPDSWYFACSPTEDFPWGYGQEETIAGLFSD